MEKGSDGLRERLLARLPQPENVVAHREDVAAFLAKHERALFWDKWSGGFYKLAGLMFIGAVSTGLQYYFNRTKVDILKEVKQVQLQVLELQASMVKDRER
jgi:hypothetical protein